MPHLVNEKSGEIVEVPNGENSVGRGVLLKVADKRVSRNHALLDRRDDKLRLCPKHRNPCFYKAAEKDSFSVLPKDIWQELHHGDCFSLLPDDLIFRVVDKQEEKRAKDSITSRDPVDELFEAMETEPTTCTATSTKDEPVREATPVIESTPPEPEAPKLEPAITQSISSVDTAAPKAEMKVPLSKEPSTSASVGSTGKRRTLPSWLSGISTDSKPPPKKRKAPAKTVSVADDESHPPAPKKAATSNGASKASSKGGSMTTAKDTAVEKVEAILPTKDSAKTSKPPSAAAAASKTTIPKEDKREAKEKKLPHCPYGAKCYRKNPMHFKEYSHDPSTDDGGSSDEDSEKPMCPYGSACYRSNPEHRREYRHSAPPVSRTAAGTRRSARTTKGKKRSVLEGDSDDDDELPNTYDYNDSFIDDVDRNESSSYGGDSEDSDWAPPAPGGREEDSVEDMADLVADAKAFISNKKMRKPV